MPFVFFSCHGFFCTGPGDTFWPTLAADVLGHGVEHRMCFSQGPRWWEEYQSWTPKGYVGARWVFKQPKNLLLERSQLTPWPVNDRQGERWKTKWFLYQKRFPYAQTFEAKTHSKLQAKTSQVIDLNLRQFPGVFQPDSLHDVSWYRLNRIPNLTSTVKVKNKMHFITSANLLACKIKKCQLYCLFLVASASCTIF